MIQSLKETPVATVYQAFARAFAEYDRQWTLPEFLKMLHRRNYDAALSFGAFVDGELVSFTLNCTGNYNGDFTGYDTGTGTVKEFRGRGLASDIFKAIAPVLREKGIHQYILEVLQHNTAAVSVYEKAGFRVGRALLYFLAPVSELKGNSTLPVGITITPIAALHPEQLMPMHDFGPSWQNSFEALARCPEDFLNFGAWLGNRLVGYGVIEPATGDIPQLAVHPRYRRRGIGMAMLHHLAACSDCGRIKVINTDKKEEGITAFMQAAGIAPAGAQFEMILDI